MRDIQWPIYFGGEMSIDQLLLRSCVGQHFHKQHTAQKMKRLVGAKAAPPEITWGKDAKSLGLGQPRTVPPGYWPSYSTVTNLLPRLCDDTSGSLPLIQLLINTHGHSKRKSGPLFLSHRGHESERNFFGFSIFKTCVHTY